MKTAEVELRELTKLGSRELTMAIFRVMRSRWKMDEDLQPAREALGTLLYRLQLLSDMLGRRRGMMEYRQALARYRGATFNAAINSPIVTGVKFEEAIQQILNREPMLAWGWQEATRKYTQEGGFALAKSMEETLDRRLGMLRTKLVQRAIVSPEVQRGGLPEFRKVFKEIAPWTNSYADTVYKTNISSAYTEARFEQVKDPDVSQVIAALEVTKSTAVEPRENHKGFEGLMAPPDDPIWQKAKPPYGYNCTHGVRYVSIFELERRGRVKDGKVIPFYPPGLARASYDPGFNPRG